MDIIFTIKAGSFLMAAEIEEVLGNNSISYTTDLNNTPKGSAKPGRGPGRPKGPGKPPRKRRGITPVRITDDEFRAIIAYDLDNPTHTARRVVKALKLKCGTSTVQRVRNGFHPKCT